MDYLNIFRKKQHTIRVISRNNEYPTNKILINNKQIEKLIKHQNNNTDMYFTKYPNDGLISTIILDFDSETDKEQALKEVNTLRNWTLSKGLNTVIVSSGKKGYHTYTQVEPYLWKNEEEWTWKTEEPKLYEEYGENLPEPCYMEKISDKGMNERFNHYIKKLIGYDKFHYKTLDDTNFKAGLKGNIRVIGSEHPSTHNKCEIIKGEFLSSDETCLPNSFNQKCIKEGLVYGKMKEAQEEQDKIDFEKQRKKRLMEGYGDPVRDNDLREVMTSLFPGEYKEFEKGYIFMQCPFHPDHNPSMVVTSNYFYCKSCEAKGNWWTLREMGYVDFPKSEIVRPKREAKT